MEKVQRGVIKNNNMKKNKQTTAQKKSTLKRALKRSSRLKKTKSEYPAKKLAEIEEKRKQQAKQDEEIMKILESRKSELR